MRGNARKNKRDAENKSIGLSVCADINFNLLRHPLIPSCRQRRGSSHSVAVTRSSLRFSAFYGLPLNSYHR